MTEHEIGQDGEDRDKRSQQDADTRDETADEANAGESEDVGDNGEHSHSDLAQAYVEFLGKEGKGLQDAFAPFTSGYGKNLGAIATKILGKESVSPHRLVPESVKIQPDFDRMKGSRMPQFEPLDLEVAHNPAHDVLEEALKTNSLLAAMVDQAKADAAESKKHAQKSIRLAWAAVIVTAVIGLVGIIQTALTP